MAKEESDEMPMLSSPGLRHDSAEPDSSLSIELSVLSIPASGPLRRRVDNRYFSGPLRSSGVTESAYFSGPLRSDRSAEIKTGSVHSAANRVILQIQEESNEGKHEHLLKSGPLGKCNDPFCTTCPVYYDYKEPRYNQWYPPATPDQKVHMAFLGGLKDLVMKSVSWSKAWVLGVMNPHTKLVQRWNKLFVISCLLAIFVDPLFFFLLSVNKDNFCIFIDFRFALVITVLRSLTDGVYFLHMLLQLKLAYVAPASRVVGAGELVDDPKEIARHYLTSWFSLDLFVVLPLPQILIWVVLPHYFGKAEGANFAKNLLRVTVLLQYIPRMIRFVPLLAGNSPTGFIFETAQANFLINLFLFILVAHVVGSCWYLFGLQRVNQCLRDACRNATKDQCNFSFLDCGHGGNISKMMQEFDPTLSKWQLWIQNANASDCLSGPSSAVFTYGIYNSAVNVTFEGSVVSKYIYSLFWGFQQITTLAGNQVPSLFVGEVLFTMGIVALGLLLLVLLIGNMQNFLQSLSRRRVEMQLRRHDVELWMARRRLPSTLRKKVLQAERFKWTATRGVNEEKILKSLPEDLQSQIRRLLCLDLVKRVRLFTVMEDQVLDAICECLRQRLYIAGSEILRVNYPIDKMHFFISGNLESIGEDGNIVRLKGGDFCGDELLSWCLERGSVQPGSKRPGRAVMGQRALSSRTVRCLGSVEAFSLDAVDLEEVTRLFSRSLRNAKVQGAIRYESPYWRTRAATCIQVAWRYRKKRLSTSADRTWNRSSTSREAFNQMPTVGSSFSRI